MKYYKNINNEVFAYEEDGSQDHLIGNKVLMTAEEVEAHLNPPKTEAEIRAVRIAEIDARLAEIDMLKVRPLSELVLDPASEFARTKLSTLEAEATQLRAERAEIL